MTFDAVGSKVIAIGINYNKKLKVMNVFKSQKGGFMKLKSLVLVLMALCLLACGSQKPSQEMMNSPLGVNFRGQADFTQAVSVQSFIADLKVPGSWKKISDNEWMYKMISKDNATGSFDEFSFVLQTTPNGQVLTRLLLNNNDLSNADLVNYYVRSVGAIKAR